MLSNIILPSLLLVHSVGIDKNIETCPGRSIDFTSYRGIPIVSSKIDDHQNLRMLIDTGSPISVLFDHVASILREDNTDNDPKRGVNLPLNYTSISVGDIQLGSGRLFVTSVSTIASIDEQSSAPYDGIIGLDVLRSKVWRMSTKARTISTSAALPDRDYLHRFNFRLENHKLLVDIDIHIPEGQEISARLAVDTGYNGSLLLFSRAIGEHVHLTNGKKKKVARLGSISTISTALIDGISINGARFRSKEMQIFDHERSGIGYDGLIGMEFFSKFDLYIDLVNNEIALADRTMSAC